MILTIVKSLGSLASSYVDGKVQTQKVKAENDALIEDFIDIEVGED